MWTNKNTPLFIAAGVAAAILMGGIVIGTLWSIGISAALAFAALALGLQSRRMTGFWLTDDVRLWAREIRRFERADQKQMPPENAMVFVGSSTIAFWKSLADDMAPLPVIRRGFGGSRILDAVHYADRIVIPYRPAAVVIFSGTNDLAGKTAKSAAYVAEKVRTFCDVIHRTLPGVPIYYIAITPTPGRLEHWSAVQEANRLIATYAETDDCVHFIDTTAHFLDHTGQPKRDLYRWDRIHLNTAGYALLTSLVKPVLMRDFGRQIAAGTGA